MRTQKNGNGGRSIVMLAALAFGLSGSARAQDIDGPIPDRDEASLEMTLLVEPPPDDAPFRRPDPAPSVRPHVAPPPPPEDPFAKYLGFKNDLKNKYGTSYYLYLSFTPQYLVTGPNDPCGPAPRSRRTSRWWWTPERPTRTRPSSPA